MANNAESIAQGTLSGFGPFARRALIESLPRGEKGLYVLSEDAPQSGSNFKFLDKALENPAALQEEIQQQEATARQLRNNVGEALFEDITLGRTALQMAPSLEPHFKIGFNLMRIGFGIRGADGDPLLPRFFREAAVVRDLDWDISERITRRFVVRFASASGNTPAYEFQDAMINTIGEFTLVSLGILDPSLFKRARGDVKQLDVLFADQLVDDQTNGSSDLVASLRKYKLVEQGPIYWCRWALPEGVKLTRMTDQLVRDFMRVTVAGDKKEVLAAFNFTDFFEKIKELRSQTTGDKAERAAHYAEALNKALSEDAFQQFLIERCSSRWFPRLQTLLKMKPKENSVVSASS
jgi:hypothetical protein